jgi:hypothetical protein
MTKVTLDQTLRSRLNGLDSRLELCDEDGRTRAYLIPVSEPANATDHVAALAAECFQLRERVKELEALCYRFLAGWSRERMSTEEVEQAVRDGGGRPLSEILQGLGAQ